jgi:hypothetical protein
MSASNSLEAAMLPRRWVRWAYEPGKVTVGFVLVQVSLMNRLRAARANADAIDILF